METLIVVQQHMWTRQIFRLFRVLTAALAIIAMSFVISGCAPQIGDACEANNDCPTGTICDRSVEGGFCTIRDCRVGECPSEAVCVSFDRHRAFCMKSCSGDDDCRDGHRCIDDQERELSYCFVAD